MFTLAFSFLLSYSLASDDTTLTPSSIPRLGCRISSIHGMGSRAASVVSSIQILMKDFFCSFVVELQRLHKDWLYLDTDF
ncbi:hypothetical protein DAI22_11g142801 [Oryza sativa Japonica Group]|nr:hypothetical protein DAI22_11g142801 [Oryza sativa Japonica Group]